MMNIFILVPVYNEGTVFLGWLPSLLAAAQQLEANPSASLRVKVVVVDDGSTQAMVEDQWSIDFMPSNLVFLRHPVNCGVGAAIGTGLAYAKKNGAELVMTIDGDAQHDPADLLKLFHELRTSSVDVVNGSRFMKSQNIPVTRRIANYLANIITFVLSGFWLSDSQSGMKGFSYKALKKLEIMSAGYEWCTDVFREANWYGFTVKEVPIAVSYSAYSLKKGQNFAIGLDMLMRLAVKSLSRSFKRPLN